MIGDEIQIKVLSSDRKGVRIGITAPETTQVHRQEVYEKIKNGGKFVKRDRKPVYTKSTCDFKKRPVITKKPTTRKYHRNL